MPSSIGSSTGSGRSSRSTVSSDDNCPTAEASLGSKEYRFTTLEPNHIVVEDEPMDDERWSRLAFALSMPCKDIRRTNPEARKFAFQMKRQKSNVSSKQVTEMLHPLIKSIVKQHKTINCKRTAQFHRESVPDEVPDFEIEPGWKTQLPTPKPAFTLGYSESAFNSHQLELQQGIIANNRNEPCDLHKVSQPIPSVYWPFFVVETQDEAMLAARNACAGSAATCNNGLMIFAGAAEEHRDQYIDMKYVRNLSQAVQSFSLAINGKTACLSTHNSEGCLPHAVSAIRTYKLDDEDDMEALASRVRSILVWAENCRLSSITDLIEKFDRRVRMAKASTGSASHCYDPMELADFRMASSKRKSAIVKEVFMDGLAKWIRYSG
ncbi:hypothetical protein LTR84_011255 [Exophiala bonariae]|uniref:DUF7924 domain-containing protein n=1 Tax=Exophiala bonariae TaxID=1690606 RepID=A0AAV9MSJ1_9EURO|nr:hypothetical protein LTR84_011255 [Exophiala bonariae]